MLKSHSYIMRYINLLTHLLTYVEIDAGGSVDLPGNTFKMLKSYIYVLYHAYK